VAVMKVGAATETELKEKKHPHGGRRVGDAGRHETSSSSRLRTCISYLT
jgi:hypothetical protein